MGLKSIKPEKWISDAVYCWAPSVKKKAKKKTKTQPRWLLEFHYSLSKKCRYKGTWGGAAQLQGAREERPLWMQITGLSTFQWLKWGGESVILCHKKAQAQQALPCCLMQEISPKHLH